MFKTLVRSLGRAPRSYADYERLFSPDPQLNGWARGDGAPAIRGNGWTLWSFNDTYKSLADGTKGGIIRNSCLLVTDEGDAYWLSSGGGESTPGAATFPAIDGSTWAWLDGGYATGDDSAMMIAGGWVTGAPYSLTGYHCRKFTGLKSDQPDISARYSVGLDTAAGVSWSGLPYVEDGYVYIFGIHFGNLVSHIARHAYTDDPSALATGWEYWTSGTSWGAIGARGNVSITSGPLRALSVIKWNGKYLFSAKIFDSGPEIATGPDAYPDLNAWESTALFGQPLTPVGVVARVGRLGWFSYGGRVMELPGVPGISAIASLNTAMTGGTINYTYGPHFQRARYSADMSRTIRYVGTSDVRTITAANFNTVGVTGEPTRSWTKENGYDQVVGDAAATYLLTQPDFVDTVGIGFPDSVDLLMSDGNHYCQQLGNFGAARTLNSSTFQHYAGTLSANCTFTLTGASVGEQVAKITIYIKQDPAVARTVSFSPTVKWAGGVAYVASTGLGALDKVELESTDGGTNWRGSYVKGYA